MILVTGGTGLVGSHLLVQLAQQEDKILAIFRDESRINQVKRIFGYYSTEVAALFSKISWIKADLNDVNSLDKAFKGVVKVYHAAALISFAPKDYYRLRKVNIEGTANLVNMCIDHQVKKLCYVSSVAAVGKPITGSSINETNEWNVSDNNYGYAITKHGAEIEVWRGSQEGLAVVIVNPGIILGAGFWQSGAGKMFSQIDKGFKFYTEGVTGFVGVEDTVKIMIQLMESEIKNQRYILVSEDSSFKSVFYAIADNLGKKRPTIKATKFLGEIAWRIEALRSWIKGNSPILTKQSIRSSHESYQYCTKKVSAALNYTFEPLEVTIKKTCKLYVKR